ncbi:MAG: hypothetical protein A2Y24_00020 [Clostridiales bacterium GWE2_32_10]|nr:MAG: hypothetical protein A2Y24_00020 [Clostridiales bacterium GWE2_32_10]
MNKNEYLWDLLNIDKNFNYNDIDNAYIKLKDKNERTKFAWKVLRDEYYSAVYKKYLDIDTLIKAGFFVDELEVEDLDYYNLDFLTTPVGKILDNIKLKGAQNPVVLLTTGGFYPLHNGHLHMMEAAKETLEEKGYSVVGGYISPSHESYVVTKPYYILNEYERLELCKNSIRDSNWLMVDPWESIYVKTSINFTDVIKRLELYLKKHVNKDIKVAYVFGGDNAGFMHCFEDKGIGICVEREGYNEKFLKLQKQIEGNNIFFINNKSVESKCSSRDIRKQQICEDDDPKCNEYKGIYAVRNESTAPLLNYKTSVKEEIIEKAQEEFVTEFVLQLQQALDNSMDIKVINLMEQLESAQSVLNNKKTISLDCYYKGTYNIETSRLFDISDTQNKSISQIGRIGHGTVQQQVETIKEGNYVLVDDDSVTGKTIKEIMSYLPPEIKIEQVYLLTSVIKEKIFDVVDLRDFIIGAQNGGLVVRLPNGEAARAPYMLPYVSLKSRANVKASNEMQFSIALWEMNKKIYSSIDRNIKLSQADCGFKRLMNYIGFKDDTLLTHICDWHIKNLKCEKNTSTYYQRLNKYKIKRRDDL